MKNNEIINKTKALLDEVTMPKNYFIKKIKVEINASNGYHIFLELPSQNNSYEEYIEKD